MGQKGAVDLRQRTPKPPLNKHTAANCMLMPHAPAQVKTNVKGNELELISPFITLWSASWLYGFGCSHRTSFPETKYIQSYLLLLSNTVISENQVPRYLPKLKPHSISFLCSQLPSAIIAARDWLRVPLWRESFFCLLFPKAAQLPGRDSLLWEGPISSPGNRVIREYQFQTYATKAKFSSDLLRWEGLQLTILCCFQHKEFFLHLKELFVLKLYYKKLFCIFKKEIYYTMINTTMIIQLYAAWTDY